MDEVYERCEQDTQASGPRLPCKRKDVTFRGKEVSSYLGFCVATISCSQATSFTTSGFSRYPFQSRWFSTTSFSSRTRFKRSLKSFETCWRNLLTLRRTASSSICKMSASSFAALASGTNRVALVLGNRGERRRVGRAEACT